MTIAARYRVAGTRVEVEVPPPLDEVVRDLLVDLEPAGRGGAHSLRVVAENAHQYRMIRDGRPSEQAVSTGLALVGVLDMLNAAVAEHWSRDHLALHAGVIERGGRSLALVGHSGAGKTTLTAAAVQAGWSFLGDEVGLIDSRFVAHAYHRPLGLRRGGRALLGLPVSTDPWHLAVQPEPASRLGTLVRQAPLAAVVFLERSSASPTEPTVMSPAAALADLLNNVLGTDGVEVKVFRRLERLVREVPVLRLAQGAPGDMLVGLHAALAAAGASGTP